MNRYVAAALVVFFSLVLVSCGGGGGGGVNSTSYTVTATAGAGGGISPASTSVSSGATASFTVAPGNGNSIDTVTGCGGTLVGSTYTTGAVTADCTVMASFVSNGLPTLGLTALSVSGASLDQIFQTNQLDYTATVGYLTSYITVSATTADAGAAITVNGTSIGADNTSQSIALAEGINPAITIVVTGADSTTVTYYTLTITRQFAATFAQQAYIKASNTEAGDFSGYGDWFGTSVALSDDGNTLAVGAPGEDSAATGIDGDQNDNSAENSGAVYLFTRSGITWSQQAYIKASDAVGGFGGSLALSGDGNTLVVVAGGTVYQFTRSGTTWNQQATIKTSNERDSLGNRLALSSDGNILAVVGWSSEARSAVVHLFSRSGNVWSQQQAYVNAGEGALALSGDGNTLAVGVGDNSSATGIDGDQTNNSAINSGAVHLFVRSGTDWSQQAFIKASNTDARDSFGYSLALSYNGNTLVVGAPFEDSGATGIGGDQSDNSSDSSGAAYLFTRSGSTWSQQAYIKASNTDADDLFGVSLALSDDGNSLLVGAHGEDSSATGINGYQAGNSISARNSGAMYLFTRSGTTWSQQAYIKASNISRGQFGASVSLSGDGSTLAAGAKLESSAATGINGNQGFSINGMFSGAVYVYY